jgi:hypothetical protein
MSDLKFTSGHECRDNGVGDFDLFCPTQPDEKVCFLPFMTALTLKAEMVCPLCREQIGKRADS